MVLVLYISIWLMSLIVPGEVAEGVPGGAHLNLKATFRQPGVIAFLIVCFLLQASHGTYYGFYSLYMEHAGYDDTMVGVLWAIGVVAEVALFLYMPKLLHQFSAKLILLVSVLLAAVRWLLIGLYADVFSLVVVAQLLHAATFGSFHAAAIHLVHGFFPGKVHGRGQALYSSLSFGAGGAIGSYASGQYWSDYGPHMVFIGAAIVALVAFLFGMIGMRKIL